MTDDEPTANANSGQGLSSSGGGGRFAASVNDLMMFGVVILLATGWTIVFVLRYTQPDGSHVVDGVMFKDVLLIVLSYAFGAASVKKGVEQGTYAALTPPSPSQTRTTTITPDTVTTTGPSATEPKA